MTGRGVRAARGLAAALLSTAVALASHLLGGAEVPGLLGVVVPLVFAVSVCTVLAGVRLSAVRLSLSVVASQVLFHTLFVLGTVPAGTSVRLDAHLGPLGHSGHAVHEGMTLVSAAGSTGGVAHAAHASAGMWLAHVGAAALTVLALHRGETLLLQLRRLATAVLTWALPHPPEVTALVLRRQSSPHDDLPGVTGALAVLAGCLPRRGPPVRPSV